MPLSLLAANGGTYSLEVPGTEAFIDGNYDHCPYDGPRSVAIYANHSARPNAKIEHWPLAGRHPQELQERMWLVATQPIEAGAEIRIDCEWTPSIESGPFACCRMASCHVSVPSLRNLFLADESGGVSNYWQGTRPRETRWRDLRIPLSQRPPRGSSEPELKCLQRLQANASSATKLISKARGSSMSGSPIAWEGAGGGDARLLWLVPKLLALVDGELTPEISTCAQHNWALVSTHLPGRSGRECRQRWRALKKGRPGALRLIRPPQSPPHLPPSVAIESCTPEWARPPCPLRWQPQGTEPLLQPEEDAMETDEVTRAPAVAWASVFAWDHAQPTVESRLHGSPHLLDTERRAGVCGDFFGSAQGVEAAAASGTALAEALAPLLTGTN